MVAFVCVVVSVVSSDDTAHRLTKGRSEEAVTFVWHQAAKFHNFVRDDAVSAGSTEVFIGISRRCKASFVVQCRLLCEFHARFELIFPFFTDFYDHTCEFMSDDDRVGVDVLWCSFVFLTLLCKFVGGHADTVTHDLYEDLVVFDLR